MGTIQPHSAELFSMWFGACLLCAVELIDHGSLHGVARHHHVAERVEGLWEVLDLAQPGQLGQCRTLSLKPIWLWVKTNGTILGQVHHPWGLGCSLGVRDFDPAIFTWLGHQLLGLGTLPALMKIPASSSCGITRPGAMESPMLTLGTAADTMKPIPAPQLDTTAMST